MIDYKVLGGKMLRMDAEIVNGTITSIRITGDFFIHPEESIEQLERFLEGKRINEGLADALDAFLRERGIRMIGMSAKDIADALTMLK